MNIIGVDLGFYQVKLYHQNGKYRFPSVIGYPSAIELTEESDHAKENNICITEGDTTYYVGSKALRDTRNAQLTFTADKTEKHTDRIKYLAALSLAATGDADTFTVATGLPVDEFAGMQGLKEQLQKNLEGEFFFRSGDLALGISVPKVLVLPQSAGAYYDYILDNKGNILEENVNAKTVVIDIGYRTTDVVTMSYAKYVSQESFTINTGVSDVHKELRKNLLKEYRVSKDLTEMDFFMRSGIIHLGGVPENISFLITACIQPYAEKIASMIPVYIPNLRDIHQVIVTGGGSNIMSAFIEAEMKGIPVTHSPDSEFSNARGYYKYATFLNQKGR